MKKLYINDTILNILIILLCISVPICLSVFAHDGKKTAIVSVDGEKVKEMPLSQNSSFYVEGMEIVVQNGKVNVTRSDCPDGLCMNMKHAEKVGDSIICVPNKVSVRIVGGDNEKGADVVAG